jgi:hypothetical protein
MVSRVGGWLGDRRMPDKFPDWLTEADIDFYAGEFKRAGFRGGLNWYRNIDRNWELMAPFAGAKVEVPALFMTGDKDLVYRSPGVEQLVANLAQFVPKLKKTVILPGCGHWTQEERKDDVNRELVAFLKGLCDQWGGLRWASQFRSLAAKRCRCPAEASAEGGGGGHAALSPLRTERAFTRDACDDRRVALSHSLWNCRICGLAPQ